MPTSSKNTHAQIHMHPTQQRDTACPLIDPRHDSFRRYGERNSLSPPRLAVFLTTDPLTTLTGAARSRRSRFVFRTFSSLQYLALRHLPDLHRRTHSGLSAPLMPLFWNTLLSCPAFFKYSKWLCPALKPLSGSLAACYNPSW